MLQHNKVPSSFWCLLEIYVDQCRGRCDDMYVVVNIMPLVPLQLILARNVVSCNGYRHTYLPSTLVLIE